MARGGIFTLLFVFTIVELSSMPPVALGTRKTYEYSISEGSRTDGGHEHSYESIMNEDAYNNVNEGVLEFGKEPPRPDHDDVAKFARWLVHMSMWGVIGTTRRDSISHEGGNVSNNTAPWTNVVDLSDGPMCGSTGRLLFYLTSLDETAQDASENPNVSFTVAEAALVRESQNVDINRKDSIGNGNTRHGRGPPHSASQQIIGCGSTDDEDPTCAKLTIIGKLLVVPEEEQAYVKTMIAAR